MSNLTLQFGFLLHQIASVSGENLKLLVDRIDRLFKKAETVDGGSENGVQIIVIGLVVAVFWLAVEARCERMDQACFITCRSERPQRWLMIRASHFDGDDEVFDVMLFARLFECQHSEVKAIAIVFNAGRLSEHVAKKNPSVSIWSVLWHTGPAKVPATNIEAPQQLKCVFDNKCFVSVCSNATP